MAPKKILVSAKWKDQFTKLQVEVLKIPNLNKVIENCSNGKPRDALTSFENIQRMKLN